MAKNHSNPDNHISIRLPESYLSWLEEHSTAYGLRSRHELAKILLMQAIDETRSREILVQISNLRADVADALHEVLFEGLNITDEDAEKLVASLRARGMTPPESVY
jgi:hypothetical protein